MAKMSEKWGKRGILPPGPLTDTELKEAVTNILTAAFEGGSYGIGYWSPAMVEVPEWPFGCNLAAEVPSAGGKIRISEEEDEGSGKLVWHDLDYAKMLKGIELAADYNGQSVRKFVEEHDAPAAEVAVQLALFGEVVYG